MTSRPLRLATRGSPLALVQARIVADLVAAAGSSSRTSRFEVELVVVETAGDRSQREQVPLHAVGGQGIFVKEVDAAVLEGRADAAVHSAKDLPARRPDEAESPDGECSIVAVPERADPRDALVGRGLSELTVGATVATGSVRRRAQLAWLRPDLVFAELRGNVATRLSKVPPGGAVVVAMAALERLATAEVAAEVLSPTVMLPQVGQGAIAVTARPGDDETAAALSGIDHAETRRALEAERAFLGEVGGGCDLPVGAHAVVAGDGSLRLEAMIATLDGHVVVRHRAEGSEPVELGARLAGELLFGAGGEALLARSAGAVGP